MIIHLTLILDLTLLITTMVVPVVMIPIEVPTLTIVILMTDTTNLAKVEDAMITLMVDHLATLTVATLTVATEDATVADNNALIMSASADLKDNTKEMVDHHACMPLKVMMKFKEYNKEVKKVTMIKMVTVITMM